MKELQFVKNIMSNSTTIALQAIVVLFFLFSCSDDKKNVKASIEEPDSIAYLSTYGVTTLISDSGRISYKIDADEWLVYSMRKPPYWAFEKGLYLETYDSLKNVETTVKCDTAFYFNEKRLWQLIGNVNIKNPKNQHFYTDMMYWDQNEEIIYSDAYIRVEQEDEITEGIGFSSNQDMSVWQIRNTKGIYTLNEE